MLCKHCKTRKQWGITFPEIYISHKKCCTYILNLSNRFYWLKETSLTRIREGKLNSGWRHPSHVSGRSYWIDTRKWGEHLLTTTEKLFLLSFMCLCLFGGFWTDMALPPQLKAIQHHLRTAQEHEKRDPVVAYYCECVCWLTLAAAIGSIPALFTWADSWQCVSLASYFIQTGTLHINWSVSNNCWSTCLRV